MFRKYFFIIIFSISGTASAQYLTYSELVGLLNIAHDDVKVDTYLENKGYGFSSLSDDKCTRKYKKVKAEYYYSCHVFTYLDSKIASSVTILSDDVALWNHYIQIVNANGYKQASSTPTNDGGSWSTYGNNEYELTMILSRGVKIDSYIIGVKWKY